MQNKIKINDDQKLFPEQTLIQIDPNHEKK